MRRHRTLALLLVVPVLALAACGDDDDLTSAGTEPPDVSVTSSAVTTATSAPTDEEPEPDLASLTETWGCAYGFRASDPEQRVAVQIEHVASDPFVDPVAGPAPVVLTLPDDAWDATIITGTDLFANWCDDVLEPGEPTPEVDTTWELTAGTLTITALGGACGGSPATATLTDATFTAPDGTTVSVDELDLRNEAWGCFAG